MDCIQHMCIYRLLKDKELLLQQSLFLIRAKKVFPVVTYQTQDTEVQVTSRDVHKDFNRPLNC